MATCIRDVSSFRNLLLRSIDPRQAKFTFCVPRVDIIARTRSVYAASRDPSSARTWMHAGCLGLGQSSRIKLPVLIERRRGTVSRHWSVYTPSTLRQMSVFAESLTAQYHALKLDVKCVSSSFFTYYDSNVCNVYFYLTVCKMTSFIETWICKARFLMQTSPFEYFVT